jgi:hypothetical protein
MRVLSATIGASFILVGAALPVMARIKPQPTLCFVQLRGVGFRDLSAVCGASARSTQRLLAVPTVQTPAAVAPATRAAGVVDRQPTVQPITPQAVRTTTTTVSPVLSK